MLNNENNKSNRAVDKIVFSFRINERQYEKVKHIASSNHRSINAQLESYVDDCIMEYEKQHGNIDVDSLFDD